MPELHLSIQSSSAAFSSSLDLSGLILSLNELNEMRAWDLKSATQPSTLLGNWHPPWHGSDLGWSRCSRHRLEQGPVGDLDAATLNWGLGGLIQAYMAQIGLRAKSRSSPIFFAAMGGAAKGKLRIPEYPWEVPAGRFPSLWEGERICL